MVTAIFVVAQHTAGFDLQVRNLRWAINRPKRIVVFTFEENHLPKRLYPDVEFVEVPGNPREYFHFHDEVISQYLMQHADEIIIMNEMDTFFKRQIGDKIDIVRETGEIHVGNTMNTWYPLCNAEGRVLQDRLWEGGLIMQAKQLLLIYEMGISMSMPVSSRALVKKFYDLDLRFRIGIQCYKLGEKENGTELMCFGDNYSALNIATYLMDYTVKSDSHISHIKGPETVDRQTPEWYDNVDKFHHELNKHYLDKGSGTVFHLFLLGKAKKGTLIYSLNKLCSFWEGDILDLLQHGEEWMPPDVFERLVWICQLIKHVSHVHSSIPVC